MKTTIYTKPLVMPDPMPTLTNKGIKVMEEDGKIKKVESLVAGQVTESVDIKKVKDESVTLNATENDTYKVKASDYSVDGLKEVDVTVNVPSASEDVTITVFKVIDENEDIDAESSEIFLSIVDAEYEVSHRSTYDTEIPTSDISDIIYLEEQEDVVNIHIFLKGSNDKFYDIRGTLLKDTELGTDCYRASNKEYIMYTNDGNPENLIATILISGNENKIDVRIADAAEPS